MKRIILLLLLVLISVNYQSCKVLKKIHRDKSVVKSSLEFNQQSQVTTAQLSDNHLRQEADWLKVIQSTDLTANKITLTEEDMPTTQTSFVFHVDSLNLKGDTIHTRAHDGTELELYQDKKTGQMVANVQRQGGKKKTLEIDGFSLKSDKKMDSGRQLEDQHNKTLDRKDSTGKQKVKTADTEKKATIDKNVKRDFGPLKWIGLVVLIGLLLFGLYKLNKAKNWIKLPFGNKGQ